MNPKDLPFTGERFVPGCGGPQIFYEHFHRYLMAGTLAYGRRVLDLASGAGYGAFHLAQTAASVTGLDLDVQALAHAAAKYAQPHLSFLRAGANRLPFGPHVFDMVVAFEIIEHLEAQEAMLAEVARVLRPSGLALISTPNKSVYSDARQYSNPFHVREFYVPEFDTLLRRYFPHVLLLGQRLTTGSLIWAPEADSDNRLMPARGTMDAVRAPEAGPESSPVGQLEESMYVIGICSAQPLPEPDAFCPSGLLDLRGEYLAELEAQGIWGRKLADDLAVKEARIRQLQQEVATLSQWGTKASAEIREKDQLILKLQAEIEALSHWGDRLAIESDAKDGILLRLQKEFDARTEWALQLDAQIREKDATILRFQREKEALTEQLAEIQRTLAYRAFRKLGALP